MFFCWDHWHSIIHYTSLSLPFSLITPVNDTFPPTWLLPTLTLLLNIGFHRTSATGVACRQGTLSSSGHPVLSHFGTCICSNVETNLSWNCLVSGRLNFEHPSVLFFCFAFIFKLYTVAQVISCTRCRGTNMTFDPDPLTWISIGINYSSRTIYLLVWRFLGKELSSYQLHKVLETNMTFDLDLWPTNLNINRDNQLTIYLPSLSFWGKVFMNYQMHKVLET